MKHGKVAGRIAPLVKAMGAYGAALPSLPSLPTLSPRPALPLGLPHTRNPAELKPQQRRGFSIQVEENARLMQTTCRVAPVGDSMTSDGRGPFNALWDTGSSCCAVTKRLVERCALRPTGRVRELIVEGGTKPARTYYADLILPGGITFMNVEVLEGQFLPDIDVLIGLDVIRSGDLSVHSSSGNSVFSFYAPCGRIAFDHRAPSQGERPQVSFSTSRIQTTPTVEP